MEVGLVEADREKTKSQIGGRRRRARWKKKLRGNEGF